MRSHVVLLIVPSLAIAVVGVAMLGPGAAQPFASVEIWGGPVGSADRVALRVLAIERLRGIDSAADVGELLIRLSANNGAAGEGRCRTDPNGACDVNIALTSQRSPALGIHADVYALPSGRELAEGDLHDPPNWGRDGAHGARLVGARSGYPALSVMAKRGIFVAPFRDELTVESSPPLPLTLSLRASGADLESADAPPQDRATQRSDLRAPGANGSPHDPTEGPEPTGDPPDMVIHTHLGKAAALGMTPRMHAVDLDIHASREGSDAHWTGGLPVVPGAMWLDPTPTASGALRIVSAVPRDVAYANLASHAERRWGGAIALTNDAKGFATGLLTLPASMVADEEPLWLTLSSDPRGSGSGTVGWPLGPERTPIDEREHAFREQRLLDGMPLAERHDQERRGRARNLAWIALFAAACVETGLLTQVAGRPVGKRSWMRLLIALATVLLAFSAFAVIVMWKTSG